MDKDLQQLFEKKNKEMLISTLKYDLDKNIGSLMETINNIFNLEYDGAIKKIAEILTDEIFNRDMINLIESSHIDIYEMVEELINKKKKIVANSIETLVFVEDKINNYYDVILNTTKFLKEDLSIKIKEEMNRLSNSFSVKNERLDDYLTNRLCGKLITKIHMEIMLRDNNLINKAKESYVKYKQLTETIEN